MTKYNTRINIVAKCWVNVTCDSEVIYTFISFQIHKMVSQLSCILISNLDYLVIQVTKKVKLQYNVNIHQKEWRK